MDGPLFLGIDVGSTALKVVVFDPETSQIDFSDTQAYKREFPAPGWFEFDVKHLAQVALHLIMEIPNEIKHRVAGVSITGQMAGLVCLDKHGDAIRKCISIFDTRADKEVAWLNERYSQHLSSHEGNRSLGIYTLPKLLWVQANEPTTFNHIAKVVLPKDYIRGVLTGEWYTDPSDASCTLMYDQFRECWDEAILQEIGIQTNILPDVISSHANAGSLLPDMAKMTGLPSGIPVFAGAADMAAVLSGVSTQSTDELVISLGTAAHVLLPVNDLSADIWPTQQYRRADSNRWYRFGAVLSGGLSLEWFLNTVNSPGDYHIFRRELSDPKRAILFVPYLSGAGAPHYQADAAGSFIGLQIFHRSEHLAQAVVEGVAMEILEVVESLTEGPLPPTIRVTGGASRVTPLVGMIADVLGREVSVAKFTDAPALGAALLAMRGYLGSGFDVAKLTGPEMFDTVYPTDEGQAYFSIFKSRYRDAAKTVRKLSGL